MAIPKRIHQIWLGGKPVPSQFATWNQSFRTQLPDWEYTLWNDDACEKLFQKHFPQHAATYANIPLLAQKSDYARYAILSVYGGLYADMDAECRRPVDFIQENDELIVAVEIETKSPKIQELCRTDKWLLYTQWALFCRPGHPLMDMLLQECGRRFGKHFSDNFVTNVINQSGPGAFTDVMVEYLAHGGNARILPPEMFGSPDGRSMPAFMRTFMFPFLGRNPYFRHRATLSWVDPKVKQQWLIRSLFFLGPPKPKRPTAA